MNDTIGFVVIEFNQASGQPSIVDDTLHRTEADAQQEANAQRAQTATTGRRERFAIASVELLEDPA